MDALIEAIGSNLDHLRAWLPWAVGEPEPRPEKLARVVANRRAFDRGERHVYGVFERTSSRMLGCVALEPLVGGRRPDAPPRVREIGYWLRADATGRGLASEAVDAVVRMGFERLHLEEVEIQCDPRNRPSARVPERLGFTLVETRHGDKRSPDGSLRDTQVWVLGAGSAVPPRARPRGQ